MAVHSDRLGPFDVDRAVVDEQGLGGLQPEAVERAEIERRVGLQQLLLARDDDVPEAAEEGILLGAERLPEIGREVGDGEERHAARVELLDDGVNARHRIGDRLAEPFAPGGDVGGVIGEFLGELGGRLVERPAGVEAVVPAPQVDLLDEGEARSSSGICRARKASGSQP
jgi:hypothetical protein